METGIGEYLDDHHRCYGHVKLAHRIEQCNSISVPSFHGVQRGKFCEFQYSELHHEHRIHLFG